jgi:hypothetical protein
MPKKQNIEYKQNRHDGYRTGFAVLPMYKGGVILIFKDEIALLENSAK